MKTLYIDIETSPNVADVWDLAHGYISLSQLREASRMLCFAYKWDTDHSVGFVSEWDYGHEEMVGVAYKLLWEADVIVHYNGHSFDIPIINRECAVLGLKRPAPFQEIDLLKVVRRNFRFTSNKLAYISKQFGLVGKVSHEGHALWTKVIDGDPAARKRFSGYTKRDVALLPPLHNKLRSWISNHPNVALYQGDFGCTKCGSDRLIKEGFSYTNNGMYQRYRCRKCGGWSTDSRRTAGVPIKGM